MMKRRDVLIGGACLFAAGSAAAMKPRHRTSLLGDAKLEDTIPDSFAGWRRIESNALVVPQDEDSLAARLYSQIVGRLFARSDSEFVMMLIAYGDTQNDLLQLHRPEVCYPAFGFQVTESEEASIRLGDGVAIPGRTLTASQPQRTEHISYWTRIGEYLPTDGREQRLSKLRTQLAGEIPDGVLVRISTAMQDRAESLALNQRFAGDFIHAIAPKIRPALVTTAVAQQLSRT